ncbi:MAG TPA: indole-3-glycerol phosphate synthase TrpC [Acidobacteriaceae bacterium]|jgi:indole-3-glycerol phosphate synthase|nr:indole-3-glycerol phosphate synthase TrpC [Acidobacteriaceae bacterium]
MDSQLTKILATTRRELQQRKTASSTRAFEQAAAAHQPRGFARTLRQKAASGPAVIAELKKASPSRGLIRADFDPAVLAAAVARGGAAALSVLTEQHFFQGSLHNLEMASRSCDLPCLRKDFIVDEFQLLEARAYRADAILLIAAALSDLELRQLAAGAHALELDVLCEVHTAEELDRVLDLDCDAVGVNNRDLKTFAVRLEVSLHLAARLPAAAVRVSESGIETGEDMNRLRAAGFHAFLIGESLMRQPDPERALQSMLLAAAERAPVGK